MIKSVPELSLNDFTHGDDGAKNSFCKDLMRGLQEYGFIILKDHNVRPALLSEAYELAAVFFSQPNEKKKEYTLNSGQRGYSPFGREHAKDCDLPDLKEFWHVGQSWPDGAPESHPYPENIWPDHPLRFKEVFTELYAALEGAGLEMLRALAPSLKVDDGYFSDMAKGADSILRLLHYPPVPDDAPVGAVRAAAHEDINLITILVAANGAGLELLTREGEWLAIETDPQHLIVDAGDMLARLTNDVIPATTHRVVNPQGANVSRYSMPFFMHARGDFTISCLDSCKGERAKYEDITAGAFLKQRLQEIGLQD